MLTDAVEVRLVTAAEFARQAGVEPRTVRRWGERGILGVYRFGRTVRYDLAAL